jgi:uncharacterized membrane protein YeaQ/YmgE (transglycosylase-associated protein family)
MEGAAEDDARLLWFDRSGKGLGMLTIPVNPYLGGWATIAPGGQTIALSARDGQARGVDIRLHDLARRATQKVSARELIAKVLLAFVPAAGVGFLLHHWIEEHLFSVHAVAAALIGGGVVIWVVEQRPQRPTVMTIEQTGWSQALWVGLAQITSLFPGVSRAAATIVGGMLAGMSRPAATLSTLTTCGWRTLASNIRTTACRRPATGRSRSRSRTRPSSPR